MTDDTTDGRGMDTARLRAVLEAYGADRTRWPAADREAFARGDLEAGEIAATAAKARELDALLSLATSAGAGPGVAERVTSRILEKPGAGDHGTVVAFDVSGGRSEAGHPFTLRGSVAASALLAASLVLGVFLGQSDLLHDIGASALFGDGPGLDELGNTVLGLQFSPDAVAEDFL